jgi:hypothetical protein
VTVVCVSHRRSALLICLLAALAASTAPALADSELRAQARLVLLDGTMRDVASLRFTPDGDVLLDAGDALPLDELRRIEPIRAADETVPAATDARIDVRLPRDGRLIARDAALTDDACTLSRAGGPAWTLSLDDLVAVRFDRHAELPAFAAAVRDKPIDRDRLFVRLEAAPVAVEGYVSAVTADTVRFEWQDEQRTLPREKLYGIVFARVRQPELPAARFTAHLHDGSRLPADRIEMDKAPDAPAAVLRAFVSAATALVVPWPDVRRIDVRSERVRFLSDLMPIDAQHKPIVALPRPWRADRAVTGAPLRAGDQSFDKGLGVQSGTTLAFDIGKEWTGFAAVLGLDPQTGKDGDCVYVVRGDGRELLRERVRGGEPPRSVRADVTGVERLELAVEYGADLDFGDHANWCDASLIRSR